MNRPTLRVNRRIPLPRSSRLQTAFATLLLLVLLIAGGRPAAAASGAERRTEAAIRADGSGRITFRRTESRTTFEVELRTWEQFIKGREDSGDNEPEPPKIPTSPPTPIGPSPEKAGTIDPLAGSIRKMLKEQTQEMGGQPNESIDTLEVTSNQVHLVTSVAMTNLDDFLPVLPAAFSRSGLMADDIRIETTTNRQLVVTISPSARFPSFGRRLAQGWKSAGTRMSVSLELPGAIVASGFPETSATATGFTFDPGQTNAIDALLALHRSPLVITADAGGLILAQPRNAKALQRKLSSPGAAIELPITDAGPGFTVEALGLSTTFVHRFPEAPQASLSSLEEAGYAEGTSPGTTIHARIFPPPGRTLQSVAGVRVLKAVDNRGRTMSTAAGAGAGADAEGGMRINSSGQSRLTGQPITLTLPLPAPDAQSIEELTAEAIVVSTGRWRELTLTNVTANATNEIDLGAVLSGAKLTVTKVTQKDRQTTVLVRLSGPESIRDLEVNLIDKSAGGSAHSSDRNVAGRGGQSTRTVQIDAYNSNYSLRNTDRAASPSPLGLMVRFPEDRRRERCQFTLRELDLL